MQTAAMDFPQNDQTNAGAARFYRRVLQTLNDSGIPFLVGGAYAFGCYTGIRRDTKDLDLFMRKADLGRADEVLRPVGYELKLTYPHWLAKIHAGDEFVDIIFNSGNGVAEVDDGWFEHAPDAVVLDIRTKINPAEEMLWSKAFVMERERYDGADVAHIIRARGGELDWQRLRDRFGAHWRVLLSYIVLFGFIYPGQRDLVPGWLTEELIGRLRAELAGPAPDPSVCSGPLLSREQFLPDIEQWGYEDARIVPRGNMTPEETATWTEAIPHKDTGTG